MINFSLNAKKQLNNYLSIKTKSYNALKHNIKQYNMTIGIYLIENKVTKKQYIGQSIHIEKRIKQHQHKRDLNNSYLENSIKKYGWENFTWTILHKCSKEELDNEEIKFIALYNTYYNGYNLTKGGEFSGLGNPMHNPILKQKAIESKKGFKHAKNTKLNLSKKNNSTGFYRVIKEKCSKCKQGFIYRYEIRKQNIRIRASDIKKLEQKVKEKNYEWHIVNEKLAEKTIIESEKHRISKEKEHPTGYYRVIKRIDKTYTNGYYYRYTWFDGHGRAKNVQATSINKLKEKVLSKDLEWIELKDNDNYKNNLSTLDFWL